MSVCVSACAPLLQRVVQILLGYNFSLLLYLCYAYTYFGPRHAKVRHAIFADDASLGFTSTAHAAALHLSPMNCLILSTFSFLIRISFLFIMLVFADFNFALLFRYKKAKMRARKMVWQAERWWALNK